MFLKTSRPHSAQGTRITFSLKTRDVQLARKLRDHHDRRLEAIWATLRTSRLSRPKVTATGSGWDGRSLASKFAREHRYANFGACVNSVKIRGFRGITCNINFEFPVTAITGLNGAGKSTVGQLLLCGHKKLSTADYKRWYIKDFFPVSVADPKPFDDDASVEYRYQTSSADDDQSLTVTRAVQEWSGYKRQPEKASIYIGLTFYLPKVERRDLTIYGAKNITLTQRAEVDSGAMWATRILGNKYDEVFFQGVASASRSAELGMAKRFGAVYSENNMGFGEGRVIHTIRLLESCPAQSLVILEEPETSLHEYAQYELAKYLMDVSARRGHQIFFSSHSSAMIRALPTAGRKMLSREQDGVKVYDRLSSIHLRNALTEGHEGHLIVCVEDAFAQSLLRETIRRKRPALLRRIKVLPFGDAIAVKGAVKVLRESEVKAVGVRDGDQPELLDDKLRSLPGDCAPERLVFLSDQGKQELVATYQFDL
jgi:predicted ATPase